MRVSSLQYFQGNIGRLNDLQAQLVQLQDKISSGVEVTQPSDDPARLFEGIQAQKAIDKAEQYNRNISFARTQLEQFDNMLERSSDTTIEAKNLLVQAANGTLSAQDRDVLATAMQALRDDMLTTVNRQDFQGRFLFSGKEEDTAPFTDGNGITALQLDDTLTDAINSVEVGQDVTVKLGIRATDAFVIDDANGDQTNVVAIMESAITKLRNNEDTTDELGLINTVFEKMQNARATVGIRLGTLDANEALNSADVNSLSALKSAAVDTDMAKAISQLVQGQTQTQAFQQTYATTSKLSLFNFVA